MTINHRRKGMTDGSTGRWKQCHSLLQPIKLTEPVMLEREVMQKIIQGLKPFKCYHCTSITWRKPLKENEKGKYLCTNSVWR